MFLRRPLRTPQHHTSSVRAPHHAALRAIRAAIKTTEEVEDWGSNDLLMGDVLRRHELQVWFLAEHVVPVPLVGDGKDR